MSRLRRLPRLRLPRWLRWVLRGIGVLAAMYALLMWGTDLVGLQSYVVTGPAMAPTLPILTVIIVAPVEPASVRPGEAVVFREHFSESRSLTRVIKQIPPNEGGGVLTRRDQSPGDGVPMPAEDMLGKVIAYYHLPYLPFTYGRATVGAGWEGTATSGTATFTTGTVDMSLSASSTCKGIYTDRIVLPRPTPMSSVSTETLSSGYEPMLASFAAYRQVFTDTATATMRVVDELAEQAVGETLQGSVCLKNVGTWGVEWEISDFRTVPGNLDLAPVFWVLNDRVDNECGTPPADTTTTGGRASTIHLPSAAGLSNTAAMELRPDDYRKVCFRFTIPAPGNLTGSLDATISFTGTH